MNGHFLQDMVKAKKSRVCIKFIINSERYPLKKELQSNQMSSTRVENLLNLAEILMKLIKVMQKPMRPKR